MARLLCAGAVLFLLLVGVGNAQGGGDKKDKGLGGLFGDPVELFKKLDANADKKLTREEFLKLFDKAGEKGELLRELFGKAFDKIATDGVVTLDQFQDMMKKLGGLLKKKKKDAE